MKFWTSQALQKSIELLVLKFFSSQLEKSSPVPKGVGRSVTPQSPHYVKCFVTSVSHRNLSDPHLCDHSLDQGVVALGVLNTKEAASQVTSR